MRKYAIFCIVFDKGENARNPAAENVNSVYGPDTAIANFRGISETGGYWW